MVRDERFPNIYLAGSMVIIESVYGRKDSIKFIFLDGTEEVDGSEAYVLKLTKKNGNIDYYYMEAESYLILKIKSKTMMNGSETEAEAILSNYQDVDGYIMAFTIEQIYGGQSAMTIMMDEVKTNVELDDSIFSKPE